MSKDEPIEREVISNNNGRAPIFSYQVVNTLTGEISEADLFSVVEVADHYQRLQTDVKTIERAIKKMNAFLMAYMDQNNAEVHELPDRRQIKIFYRQVKQINREDLAKYLDSDTLDAVMKVDNKAAKEVIVEMAQRGELPSDAWKNIDMGSTVVSSSKYLRVIK